MHRPVIYRSVKPLHWNVVYPTVPHDLTQNDEADRVLLCTGHHRQKAERICGMADFSSPRTPASPIRNHTIKKIIIHAPDKSGGKRRQTVEIIFNFVDEVEIPVLAEPMIAESTLGRRKTA